MRGRIRSLLIPLMVIDEIGRFGSSLAAGSKIKREGFVKKDMISMKSKHGEG